MHFVQSNIYFRGTRHFISISSHCMTRRAAISSETQACINIPIIKKIMFVVTSRSVARIFQRGGHTVPKRGYSLDFHVGFTTCCRLFQKGGVTRYQNEAIHHIFKSFYHLLWLVCLNMAYKAGVMGTPGPPPPRLRP